MVDYTDPNTMSHYGVKGMRWGYRGTKDSSPVGVSLTQVPGKRVKATGGQNAPASDDAKRAATLKQTAKKSSTDSLSNKELQDLVQRMNLEQQYARLSAPQKSNGRKLAERILFGAPKNTIKTGKTVYDAQNTARNLYDSPLGQMTNAKYGAQITKALAAAGLKKR